MLKKALATAFGIVLCSAVLRADLTITTVTTMQGGMAAMAGAGASPTSTTRIKGQKARVEIEVMGNLITTLVDLAAKQVTVLHPDTKTAQVISSVGADAGATPQAAMPKIDASLKPTGQTKNIDGMPCDEYVFSMTMNMADMNNAQMPAQAAEMMRDLQMAMSGSMWIAKNAPGTAEYVAFQKAATDANLMNAMMGGAGNNSGSMEKLMQAFKGQQGIPYLTEMTMTIDGSGQVADMMRQSGPMTITSKVSKISTDTIADDLLIVPADYKVVKH